MVAAAILWRGVRVRKNPTDGTPPVVVKNLLSNRKGLRTGFANVIKTLAVLLHLVLRSKRAGVSECAGGLAERQTLPH